MGTLTLMQSYSDWVVSFTEQIGRGIEKARIGRSDQWISQQTEKLGHPISRTAISEYRRGVRKVMPVTDWLTISAALGVPPISLLFPDLPDGEVQLFPVVTSNSFDALRWVTGERRTVPNSSDALFDVNTFELMGVTEGIRGYTRSNEDSNGFKLPEHDDKTPPRELRLLRLIRELSSIYRRYAEESSRTWDELNSKLPKEVLEGYISARMKILDELSETKTEIEKQIKELGGVIREEKVTPVGDEDGDD